MLTSPVPDHQEEPDDDEADEGGLLLPRRPVAPERGDHQEVAPVEGARTEGRSGQHEEDVARVEGNLPQLAGDALAGAVDGDHRAAVAPPEARLLEGVAHEPRSRSDDGLVEAAVDGRAGGREVALLGGRQAAHLLQVQDPGDVAGEREAIAHGEDLVRTDRRDPVAVALHLDQEHALEAAQSALGDAVARDPGLVGHDHLERELARVGVGGLARGAPLGQEQGGEGDHGDEAGDGERQADLADLPQSQRGVARVLEQARDHQVGRGADQRDGAADDRREADRHQVARRRAARPARPRDDARDHHGDDRGVVEERRGGRRGHEEPGERAALPGLAPAGAGPGGDAGDEGLEHAGAPRGGGQHVEGGDRQGRGVREPRERLVGVDHAERQQRDDAGEDGQGRRQALRHEDGHHRDHDDQGDDGVGAHDPRIMPTLTRRGAPATLGSGPHRRLGSDE